MFADNRVAKTLAHRFFDIIEAAIGMDGDCIREAGFGDDSRSARSDQGRLGQTLFRLRAKSTRSKPLLGARF